MANHEYDDAQLELFRQAATSWLAMQEANIERRWNTDQKGLTYSNKDFSEVAASLAKLGFGFKINVVGNPTATFILTDEVLLKPTFVKSPHAHMTGLSVVLSPLFDGSKARPSEKSFLETLTSESEHEAALAKVRGGAKTAKYFTLLRETLEARFVSGPRDLESLGIAADSPQKLSGEAKVNLTALMKDFWSLRDTLFAVSGPIEH